MPRLVVRSTRLLAVLVALELLAGVASTFALQPAPRRAAATLRAAVPHEDPRAAAVQALLTARADAITRHDRAAWLATVDPTATAFAARQARLFDALQSVPVQGWTYELDPERTQPANPAVDSRRGDGWWGPAVTLRYRLAGFDSVPTAEPQHLTFVPRGDRWYVAADDDFADRTSRGLWDEGPVTVVRGRSSLVLGHPSSATLMRTVADAVDAAVPRVTAVWGTAWSRKVVVLVPSTQRELQRLVGGAGDFSRIAAVATAELTGSRPVGDRVIINPPNFRQLGALGRRVVLTHEVTHVATRAATGNATPTWLVEGFADYIGYLGADVSSRVAAQELRVQVRRGRLPATLPADVDFDGGNARLAQVYEQAWLAAVLLARRYGSAKLVAFYRAVGSGLTVDAALQRVLGTDLARFTRDWRRDLQARLA
ncbi:MAG: peptidase MA family metallohydrolase [Mycobacteriales bacterium]